jgi:hypothetical protein
LIAIFTDVTWNGFGTITFTTLIDIFTDVTWNGSGTITYNPDDYDLYENSTTIKIIKNVSGGKCNRSGAIPSDISENNNQVGTVSDSASSYETAQESSESSTESGEAENTTNDQIQASPCIYNIVNANNVTLNIANK